MDDYSIDEVLTIYSKKKNIPTIMLQEGSEPRRNKYSISLYDFFSFLRNLIFRNYFHSKAIGLNSDYVAAWSKLNYKHFIDNGRSSKNTFIVGSPYPLEKIKKKISNKKINDCDLNEINHLTFNSTLNNKFPRKTYMGSDYFYMDNNEYINYQFKKSNIQYPPASSLALGGLSNGWGSAIMPISFNDKDKLPYNIQELKKYYNLAVNEIKFSSIYDRKQNFFENFKMPDNSLSYTRDIEKIFCYNSRYKAML